MTIHIYGRGKLGEALAKGAAEAGITALLFPGRSEDAPPPDSALVILAIPDGAVASRMKALDARYNAAIPFVHVAGTLPSRFPLPSGRPTGGMHPLISFASREYLARLRGRTFTLRGDRAAIERARAFVIKVAGVPLVLELSGPAYHASAALLANGAVALAERADLLLESLGVDAPARHLALAGLLESVADNLRALGPSRALTGPIARGDVETVKAHQHALSDQARRDYDAIAKLILRTSERAGLHGEARERLAQAIDCED